jgi:hypothetical protein
MPIIVAAQSTEIHVDPHPDRFPSRILKQRAATLGAFVIFVVHMIEGSYLATIAVKYGHSLSFRAGFAPRPGTHWSFGAFATS